MSGSNDEEQQTVRDERFKNGQCPTCGTQLFKVKKKGLLNKQEKRLPLNTPGLVSRGQCLRCLPKASPKETEELLAVAAIAAAGDGKDLAAQEEESEKPRAAQKQPNNATAGETVYIGDFNEFGERHGPGELLWSNGDKYVGSFVNGLRNGQGTLFFKDGRFCTCCTELKYFWYHIFLFVILHLQPHQNSPYVTQGSEYVGEWEHNLMHGSGTRRFKNGDVYVGQYKAGKRSGEGRFYFANGDMYYGNWEADQIHGFGRYYYNSGISFEGTFNHGKRHGKGKLQKRGGELDIYKYENNVRLDPGVRWSADRAKAWRLEGGRIKKSISIAEAVSIGYQCEGAVEDSREVGDLNPITVPNVV